MQADTTPSPDAADHGREQGAAVKPLLVFAHANSFPAGTYRKLFALLGTTYDIAAPERFGHDPRHPVGDGWSALQRELLQFVLERGQGRPVILVGHSLGGYLSLMVARQAPRSVRCVILLDSPVVAGWRATALWLGKRSGLASRLPPAAPAWRRRTSWDSLEAVRAHFAAKEPFARWDPEMLADYARCGTREKDGKRVLAFDREVEARIYQTLPHRMGRVARPPFPVPVGFIGGTESREIRQAGMAATHRLVGPHLQWIQGGSHLYPFEQPQATAAAIGAMVRALAPD